MGVDCVEVGDPLSLLLVFMLLHCSLCQFHNMHIHKIKPVQHL